MFLRFLRARPLQAAKLAAIVLTVLYALGGLYGVLPDHGLTGLFLVVLLGIGLAVQITAETLLVGFRAFATDGSLTDRFDEGRLYPVVRAIEIAGALAWGAGFAFLVSLVPESPIGLLFMLAGIGVVILGASLLRTLTEYHYFRRTDAA